MLKVATRIDYVLASNISWQESSTVESVVLLQDRPSQQPAAAIFTGWTDSWIHVRMCTIAHWSQS